MTDAGHRVERAGAVATLVLDRPATYNALTRDMLHALRASLATIAGDERIRALIVTGAGTGFCAGQALDDQATLPLAGEPDLARAVRENYNPVIRALLTLEKPVVAAINGVAAGAGMGLALSCDLRIMARSASFTTAFVKVGLVPDSGVSWLLPRLIGDAKARELCLLADRIDAETAERLGLVTACVDDDALAAAAQALAARLAAGPRALGLIKRQLLRSAELGVFDALEYEAQLQGAAGMTADSREGIAAFRAKRTPQFEGR